MTWILLSVGLRSKYEGHDDDNGRLIHMNPRNPVQPGLENPLLKPK